MCVCVCIFCAPSYARHQSDLLCPLHQSAHRSPLLLSGSLRGTSPIFFFGGGYILLVWITIVAIVKTLDDATIAPVSKPSQNIIWPWLPSLQSHHGSLNPQIHHDLPSLLSHLGRKSPQTRPGGFPNVPALDQPPGRLPLSPVLLLWRGTRLLGGGGNVTDLSVIPPFSMHARTWLHLNLHWTHLHLIQTSSAPLLKRTPHCTQTSGLIFTKRTPEAISDIYLLLTYLFTHLLCPLQRCVSRSPVCSFKSHIEVCGSSRVHEFLSRHIPSSYRLIIPLIRYFEYHTYHPVICITLFSK